MATGVGVSECCLSGKIASGTPTGKEDNVGGVPTYIAEPKDGSRAKSVVFLVDIFGWKLPNVRLLADSYARQGFYAYIPDIHNGDSLPIDFLDTVEPPLPKREALSLTERAANTAKTGATLGPWLIRHRESEARPIVEQFITHVRTIPGTRKVGAIGFCWGGRYAILAGQAPFSGTPGSGIDAAYACHPSLISVKGDFDPVVVPVSLAVGDKDSLLDPNQVDQIKDRLMLKQTGQEGSRVSDSEVKVYEDQVHGFALRGDWSSEKDKQAMDEAENQGIAWFERFLS